VDAGIIVTSHSRPQILFATFQKHLSTAALVAFQPDYYHLRDSIFTFILFKFHPVIYHFQLRKISDVLHSIRIPTFSDSHSAFYGTVQTHGKQHAITFHVGEECIV
jgi:hypothetical protein